MDASEMEAYLEEIGDSFYGSRSIHSDFVASDRESLFVGVIHAVQDADARRRSTQRVIAMQRMVGFKGMSIGWIESIYRCLPSNTFLLDEVAAVEGSAIAGSGRSR
jgi:hypothetical protein